MHIDDQYLRMEYELSELRSRQATTGMELGRELDREGAADKSRISVLNANLREAQDAVVKKETEKRELLKGYGNMDIAGSARHPISIGGVEHRSSFIGADAMQHMEDSQEARELQGLVESADLGRYVTTVITGGNLDGAEGELRSGAGLGVNEIPISLFEPKNHERRAMLEQRTDASTTIADANYAVHVARVTPYVFSRSIAPRLGVQMPTTQSGAYSAPGITTSVTAGARDKGSDQDATAVVFAPRVGDLVQSPQESCGESRIRLDSGVLSFHVHYAKTLPLPSAMRTMISVSMATEPIRTSPGCFTSLLPRLPRLQYRTSMLS